MQHHVTVCICVCGVGRAYLANTVPLPPGKVYGCCFLKTWPTLLQGMISRLPPHCHTRNEISKKKKKKTLFTSPMWSPPTFHEQDTLIHTTLLGDWSTSISVAEIRRTRNETASSVSLERDAIGSISGGGVKHSVYTTLSKCVRRKAIGDTDVFTLSQCSQMRSIVWTAVMFPGLESVNIISLTL